MNTLIKSTKFTNIIKSLCILTVFIAEYIGISHYYVNARLLLLLAVFVIFYVFLPGVFIVKLLGLHGEHLSTTLARGFFTGFALNVLLYFLSALIGSNLIHYLVGPALSIALILITNTRKQSAETVLSESAVTRILKTVWGAPVSFYLFALCVFIHSVLTTQYTYISPAHSAYSAIKLDFGYHAGVINALAAGFPPQDPWIDGLTIQYHYFTELLWSIPVRLFGLNSEELLMYGTPIVITPVLAIALYSFFREFAGKKENAGIYCLALHFSNMFMIRGFASSWFLYHIYSNINNAGMGISCLLVMLPLLKFMDTGHAADKRSIGLKETLFLSLLVMLTTGIKGPVAIVFVGGLIGTFLLSLLLGKFDVRALIVTLLSSASFLLIYVYILGSQGSQETNETGGSLFNPFEVTDIFFLKPEIMDAVHGSRLLQWMVLFLMFSLFYFTAFLFPFVIGYIRELFLVLTKRKEYIFSRVSVYASCLVGFIGLMLLNFSGHSQVYFGFVTSALVPVIAFWFFEDMSNRKSAILKLIKIIFYVSLVLTTATMMLYTLRSSHDAYNRLLSKDENNSKYRNVTTQEYEGLIWIRDHTEKDALIASDRYYSAPLEEYDYANRDDNVHFAYAIYSRRRQYMEGAGFSLDTSGFEMRREMVEINNMMFDPDNTSRGDLARSLGVDYIIVSKRFNPVSDLSNDDYTVCFSNDEMVIYSVKQ